MYGALCLNMFLQSLKSRENFTNEHLQWSFTVAYLAPLVYARNPYTLNVHFNMKLE